MASEEKDAIAYEIHEEKSGEGDDLDELENIRREVELIKSRQGGEQKIQISMARMEEGEELGDVLSATGDENEQLLHMERVAMEAAQGLVEEIIQEEEDEIDEINGTSKHRVQPQDDLQSNSQMKYRMLNDETFDEAQEPREKIDKDDPRSRLHFVKYLKRDGKTVKIWECGICTKEFRHQYTLMRHLPTHTDERNFRCDTCGKAFRQMSTLSQHRAIHSDARPYVCEVCKKTFNRVSTLISHRKTHSELKPHSCDICGKGFHQKGNLRNHIFTHTNERPYKCEVCGKGFNQMSNLMCHKVKLCDTEFPRRFSLKTHQEFKHGIKFRIPDKARQIDQQVLKELMSRKKKRDGKNLRIVHLPNGDRTLADVRNIPAIVQAHAKAKSSSAPILETEPLSTAGVLIDPIKTKAMATALAQGQTPFALLKPAKGIPVLVKVINAANNKQMLVPATAEDLKSAGKVTVSPSVSSKGGEPMKAVQIKVPVVATVVQKVLDYGQLVIEVEPPTSEQQQQASSQQPQQNDLQEESNIEEGEEIEEGMEEPEAEIDEEENEMQQAEFIKTESVADDENMEENEGMQKITYVREDGSVISEEELADLNPVNLLTAAVNFAQQQPGNEASKSLMELAGSGIQFVRPGEDGTFEILSQEEATQMMSEGGQAIEIVGDEQSVAEVVGEDGDDAETQGNISDFVDAIKSAGYQVSGEQKQFVISGSGEHIVLDEEQQLMFGESGQIIVMGEDGQQVQYVLQEQDDEEQIVDD